MSSYDPVNGSMDFGSALDTMRDGHRAYRVGWNGPGQYVKLHRPGPGDRMTKPFFYIFTAQGDMVPWVPSQGDLLALDWREYLTPPDREFKGGELA